MAQSHFLGYSIFYCTLLLAFRWLITSEDTLPSCAMMFLRRLSLSTCPYLLPLQLQMLITQGSIVREPPPGKSHFCDVCGHQGTNVSCSRCFSSFHSVCISLDRNFNMPEQTWLCHACRHEISRCVVDLIHLSFLARLSALQWDWMF